MVWRRASQHSVSQLNLLTPSRLKGACSEFLNPTVDTTRQFVDECKFAVQSAFLREFKDSSKLQPHTCSVSDKDDSARLSIARSTQKKLQSTLKCGIYSELTADASTQE